MKKGLVICITSLSIAATAQKIKAQASSLKNSKDSLSYALGVNIGRNLKAQGLDKIDALKLYKGLSDILLNKKTAITDEQAGACINNYITKNKPKPAAQPNKQPNANAELEKNKEDGRKFLAANAKKQGIVSMPGGWQYEVLKTGEDTAKPNINSVVTCHYHGTLTDGSIFESSVQSGNPITYPLTQLIKGWQLALPMMTVGSKWKLYIPSNLAYGDSRRSDKIGPGMTLIFEMELLSFK